MKKLASAAGLLLALAGGDGAAAQDHPLVLEPAAEQVVVRLIARIDGSDRIVLDERGVHWQHRHWKPAESVSINGLSWDPQRSPSMSLRAAGIDARRLLDGPVRLWYQARGLVTVARSGRRIVLQLADPAAGSDNFSLALYTPSDEERAAAPDGDAAPPARGALLADDAPRIPDALRIRGAIDDTLTLRVTTGGLEIVPELSTSVPETLNVNGIHWNLQAGPLRNEGATRFLAHVDVGRAELAAAEHRDTVAIEVRRDQVFVRIADTLPGSAPFDLTAVFPDGSDPGPIPVTVSRYPGVRLREVRLVGAGFER